MTNEGYVLIATQKPFKREVRDGMVELLKQSGLEARVLERHDARQLQENLSGAVALIVRSDKVDQGLIDTANGLKVVVRAGSDPEKIDYKYAESKGIIVENTPGMNSNAVAELALGMMISLSRNLHYGLAKMYDVSSQQEFNGLAESFMGTELKGKKLGVHGFGNIGKIVARKASAMGMTVLVQDVESPTSAVLSECGARFTRDPKAVYDGMDYVSVHVPITPDTIRMVNYELMGMVSPRGILVNTARPALFNMEDLARILKERNAFKVGVDVDSIDHLKILRDISLQNPYRMLLTPKTGAQTEEANDLVGIAAARQGIDLLIRGVAVNSVNSPLPAEMRDYATLAQALGSFSSSFVESPNKLEVVSYGGLEQYARHFSHYVINGHINHVRGARTSLSDAIAEASSRGIRLDQVNPDPRRVDGNSIEVRFYNEKGESSYVVGRIDRGKGELTQIGEFSTSIPIVPLQCVVAQYYERKGMADEIGRALTNGGYNKVNGGFRPNERGDKAMAFFQVSPNGDVIKPVEGIVRDDIARIPGIIRAVYID